MQSILATKLFVPPPRPKLVVRSRLIERLNDGLHRKLTLISAPAGFGKTTLISEWITDSKIPTAWLSLDDRDNDLTRFIVYFVSALQTIAPNVGEAVLAALESIQTTPAESILTALVNEIATLPHRFLFVLDDYHLIDSQPIDQALTFLIENLPAQMHMVITTREDPQLPLARLRVRGHLMELRAADLRFSPDEAATLLNQIMGLNLSAKDIDALEARTEGWIAGLQLAALSIQDQQDASEFIRAFAGDHRYVVDYLVEEVLQRQPEQVRSFLLQTAILERLNGSLCDAMTGQDGGSMRLEALERGNYFVVPLDDKRRWYRYHHLFAEVLYAHLTAEQPDLVPTLHLRASVWYEQHASPGDAIRHALAATDFERAAGLIELAAPATRRDRQEATLLAWLMRLPEAVFHFRPVLSIEYAGALLSSGVLEGVETRLRDAERWLDALSGPDTEALSPEMVVMDAAELRRLPGWIAVYRAGQSLAMGNLLNTMTYARQVLDVVADDDHVLRGAASALIGLVSWTSGDLDTAYPSYEAGMAHLRLAGNISDAVGGALALADIRVTQGRQREARRIYEQALQIALDHGNAGMRGTADMYVGLSELEREYDHVDAARQYLLRSKEQGDHTGFPQYRYRWRVAMARLLQVDGDLDGALDLLNEAERVYVSDFFPNVRPVSASVARLWAVQGRIGEALGWARDQGLSVDDELSYIREFEHITLARILLAQHQVTPTGQSLAAAETLLGRLSQAAENGARTKSVIEILLLQALAHQMEGDMAAALVSLERALRLAESEGYVRMFVDEGPPMARLLRHAAQMSSAPNYVRRLLAAFDKTTHSSPVKQDLIESLSDRELEVLRLLGTDLDGPDIARELTVSLNTVRTHTKNIYTKLGVNNRRAAVHRAEELNLL